MRPQNREFRNKWIYELVLEGHSLKGIAQEVGLKVARIRELAAIERSKEKKRANATSRT